MDYSKQLNDKQSEAVLYKDSPLLILAGAGSGKTRVLTYKMAYLISECGFSPDSILGVTFTNKAANEMKDRVARLLGTRRPLWVSTFHSACVRILRRDIDKLEFGKNFIIYDEQDKQLKIKEIIKRLNIDDKRITPGSVISAISQAKNGKIDPGQYARSADDFFTRLIAEIYTEYEKDLKKDNALDFDDLLLKTVELFEKHPDVLGVYQNKFKYILVDEYQDINHIQYLLVKYLSDKHKNICVVGDDDQSIYAFRGADVSIILQFEKDFPSAKVVKLEQNYRSTKTILESANSLVKYNSGRKPKKLWTRNEDGDLITEYCAFNESDEARYVINKIKALCSEGEYSLRDFAVLYRTNAQSRALEEFLLSSGLAYKIVGGVRFYERREVKDLIAYLRICYNPHDSVSIKRVINTPSRGIGKTTLEKIYRYSADNNISSYDTLTQIDNVNIQNGTKLKIKEFLNIISKMREEVKGLSLSDTVRTVLSVSGLRIFFLQDNTADSITRVENLDEFISVACESEKKMETPNLENFLAEIALFTDIDNYSENEEVITLMTLHCSKGLEFPVVFIVGLEEGVFPHARSLFSAYELEEERRLCYVGITRAGKRLYLTHAKDRTIFGSMILRDRSRFLDEIDPDFILNETPQKKQVDKDIYIDRSIYDSDEDTVTYEFRKGQTVMHHLWGKGKVTDTEDEEITVEFKKLGVKVILAEYLKPVDTGDDSLSESYTDAGIGDKIVSEEFGSGVVLSKDDLKIIATFPGLGNREIALKD
ncbi:MAG: UvrD-helicase domain-containing protein [Armatimonadota bacterium]